MIEDERQRLQEREAERHEHVLVDDPADGGRETHDESDRETHADGGIDLIGTAEERAAAEELREDEVIR